jgi:sec-independent protein translocase protein TatB
MFGIGTYEFLVIVVVAVLVLGPEHLPRVIRTVTKVMSDFRRISTEFQRAINLEIPVEDSRQSRVRSQGSPSASFPKEKNPPDAAELPQDGSAPELALAAEPTENTSCTAPFAPETVPATAEQAPSPSGSGQAPDPDSSASSFPTQGDRP